GRHAEPRRGASYADRGGSRHVRRHRPQPGQRRPGAADRNRVQPRPRRDRPQLGTGPAPGQHRPGGGLVPGDARELQLRLECHAERAATDAGAPGRLAAGLRRAGRAGRCGHAQLPGRHDVSSRPRRVAGCRRHPARDRGLVLHRAQASRRRGRSRLWSGLWSGPWSGPWSGRAGSLGAAIGRGRQRPSARLAGRARCHRADLRGGRPGGAGRPGTRLPDLAAVACIRAARPGDVAALGRVRRHGRVGTAVRGTTVRQQPVRFVRRAGAGVRPRRAGRRAHAGGRRPRPGPRGPPAHHHTGGKQVSTVTYSGILLALVATTAYNVGLILEKRALGQIPSLNLRRVLRVLVSLATSRAWLGGFALMLTGLACQTIALTFEPVSVVQPVLASGVVLVLVLSRLVLRERLHGGETWCVAAIAVAVVLLAMSATGAKDSHHASPGWVAAIMV